MSDDAALTPKVFLKELEKKALVPEGAFPKTILFVMHPPLILKNERLKKLNTQKFFTAKYLNVSESLGVISGVGIGAPSVSLFLELAIEKGAENLLLLGTCGGLEGLANLGELNIVNEAFCAEGTSAHYKDNDSEHIVGAGVQPNLNFQSEIKSHLGSQGQSHSVREAKTWTTDALFRETYQVLGELKKQNISLVDMEASAFFQICQFRKVRGAALFAVSDVLPLSTEGKGWRTDVKLASDALNSALKCLLEFRPEDA